MRLVVDTNILISALLTDISLPAHLIVLWREGRFVRVPGLDPGINPRIQATGTMRGLAWRKR